MPKLIRAVIDSNAVDAIAAPPERYDIVRAAVDEGRLELLWTHVNIDELANTKDPEKRARLLTIAAAVCRFVPTGVMVLNYSRLNFARFSDDEEAFEAFRKGNLRHTRDAILAATAQYERADLLTHDKQLTSRAAARGIRVWSPDELDSALTAS